MADSAERWEFDEFGPDECALMSEDALAKIWDRPEEDAAWAYLQIYAVPRYPLLGWKNDPRTVS